MSDISARLAAATSDRDMLTPPERPAAPAAPAQKPLPTVDRPWSTRSLAGLVFLLTMALAIRIVWVGLVQNEQVADFQLYDTLATSLTRGQGYVDDRGLPSAFKPVGYPLALSLVYRVCGESPFAAKVVQANLSVLLCLLVFLLARRLGDDTRAFVALTLAVFFPDFTLYTTLLGTELLFSCLILSSTVILLRCPDGKDPSSLDAALAGLAMGAAGLVRPMALIAPVGLLGWLVMNRSRFLTTVKILFVYSLCLALPVAPWTYRNWTVFGKPVLISTNAGFNLLYGNNPTGDLVWIPTEQLKKIPGFPPDAEWSRMDEPARSAAMRTLALDHIKRAPVAFFTRWPRKFYNFLLTPHVDGLDWNMKGLAPDARLDERTRTAIKALRRGLFYVILALGLISMLAERIRDPRFMLLYAMIFFWTLFHLVMWAQPRFSFPLTPLLIVLAAGPLAWLARNVRHGLHRRREAR